MSGQFVIATPLNIDGSAGDAVHTRELAAALHRRGRLAALITTGDGRLLGDGISFHSAGMPDQSPARRLFRLGRLLRRIATAGTLIHVRDPYVATIADAVKRRGVRVVFEVNGVDPPLRRVLAARDTRNDRLYKAWYHNRLRAMSVVAFTGENDQRHFEELFPDIRGPLIPNGVDQTVYRPRSLAERTVIRSTLKLSGDPLICYAGFLRRDMGLPTAIHALGNLLSTHPGAELIVAGDGPDRAWLEELARSQTFAPSIRFLGSLTQGRVAEIIGASDLGFAVYDKSRHPKFPSSTTPFSMKELSYLACGVPVVTSLSSGFLIDNDVGVAVDPDDPKAAAHIIRGLIGNRERLSGMRERARILIEQGFTWDRTVERWIAAVDSAIS